MSKYGFRLISSVLVAATLGFCGSASAWEIERRADQELQNMLANARKVHSTRGSWSLKTRLRLAMKIMGKSQVGNFEPTSISENGLRRFADVILAKARSEDFFTSDQFVRGLVETLEGTDGIEVDNESRDLIEVMVDSLGLEGHSTSGHVAEPVSYASDRQAQEE